MEHFKVMRWFGIWPTYLLPKQGLLYDFLSWKLLRWFSKTLVRRAPMESQSSHVKNGQDGENIALVSHWRDSRMQHLCSVSESLYLQRPWDLIHFVNGSSVIGRSTYLSLAARWGVTRSSLDTWATSRSQRPSILPNWVPSAASKKRMVAFRRATAISRPSWR